MIGTRIVDLHRPNFEIGPPTTHLLLRVSVRWQGRAAPIGQQSAVMADA
jgi:hypothetical protein